MLFLHQKNTEPPVTKSKYKRLSEPGLNIDNVRKTVTVVRPPAQFNMGKNKRAVSHLCNFQVLFFEMITHKEEHSTSGSAVLLEIDRG